MASDAPPEPTAPTAPPLPAGLVEPGRVIAVGAVAWTIATILAFAVPALEEWRPVSIAGLSTGVLGTSIFIWQRSAAQRGARGAQTGLATSDNRDYP